MKKMLILSALLVLSVSCGKTKKNTISANSGGYNTTQNLNAETKPTYAEDHKYHFTQYADIHYRLDILEDKLEAYGINVDTQNDWDSFEDHIIVNRRGKIRHRIAKRHLPNVYRKSCQKHPERKRCQQKRFHVPVLPEACDNLRRVEVKVDIKQRVYSASDLQAISELVNDYSAYANDYYNGHVGLNDNECIDIQRSKAVSVELEEMLKTFSASTAGLTQQK